MIDVTDVTKSYGPVEALRGVTFHIAAGEIVGVAGVDGAILAPLLRQAAPARDPSWESAGALLEGWFREFRLLVSPPRLVSGHDVLTLTDGRGGPHVGAVLEAVREAQVAGLQDFGPGGFLKNQLIGVLKKSSMREVRARRAAIVAQCRNRNSRPARPCGCGVRKNYRGVHSERARCRHVAAHGNQADSSGTD